MRTNRAIFSLLLTALILSSLVASAQRSVRELQQYMTSIRQTPYQPLPESVLTDGQNETGLLNILAPFYSDTTEAIRSKAYYITKRIGQKSNSASVRQQVVHRLVLGIRDRSSGISGLATEALTGFSKADFSSVDRDSIGNYIRPKTAHLDEVMKLAGYLELSQYENRIMAILSGNAPPKYKWAARLALARLGNIDAINYIGQRVSNANINDNFVYDILPDLIYTRQKTVFQFIETIIQSDREDCSSADPDSERNIRCGYRVMEYIAPAIQGFPVAVDDSGELETNDYPLALATVRSWLNQNPGYTLRTDAY